MPVVSVFIRHADDSRNGRRRCAVEESDRAGVSARSARVGLLDVGHVGAASSVESAERRGRHGGGA